MIRTGFILLVWNFLFHFSTFAGEEGVHLSAYYYPWYERDGRHWEEGYHGKSSATGPALGLYSSRDPETIVKHVNWSRQMGVKNWVCAWWGKDSWEDVTLKLRVAPILDQLKDSENQRPTTFCLFYESEGLLGLDPAKGIEFDDHKTRKLIDDFTYLSTTYFNHPSYYRINQRPVVYLYLSRTFSGDFGNAIDQVRKTLKARGFDLYLIGDEVYWGEPNPARIRAFDAITSYNMHGPPPDGDWAKFFDDCDAVYLQYRKTAAALNVAFIPGLLPGFNSHDADPAKRHYIIPRQYKTADGKTISTLDRFIEMAKRTLDPDLKAATVTSFNEWHEGTQLEPSKNGPITFPSLLNFSRGTAN